MPRILMVAAENDALRPARLGHRTVTGKVGGIGDVVRDASSALSALDCELIVVTPGYGVFGHQPAARELSTVHADFGGAPEAVQVYRVPARQERDRLHNLVLEHPLFGICGKGNIYCDDPPNRPFARDATKYALFCAAVAESVARGAFGELDVVHLHDWHAALLLALRRFHPRYRVLRDIHCVYTVHNLAIQGVRPLTGDPSSLESWYPGLDYDSAALCDPRWLDCVNPMAAGIRLADAVHAVSPTYASEILEPSAVAERGYYGGEGLENELRTARKEGRLFGILNGCEYPSAPVSSASTWSELVTVMRDQALRWLCLEETVTGAHLLCQRRLDALSAERPGVVVTSVGRITDQKLRILLQATRDGDSALECMLTELGRGGVLLLLGSGDADLERQVTAIAVNSPNLVFLHGYSDAVAQALYAQGDLFLMPSSFEPCGISQMLAMRAGQPCLVHCVGGLKDTVTEGETGFAFVGDDLTHQADALVAAFRRALSVHREQPERWQAIRDAASAARFRWTDAVEEYMGELYRVQLT